MQLSIAIPELLMLALALQGFILSGILWYSSRKIKSNRWISLLIFCISVETILPLVQSISLSHSFAAIYYLLFPVNLALGPLIYFYTRSLIFGDTGLPRRKYLYFLPMLIDLKHQIIFLLYTSGILAIPFVQQLYFSPQIQSLLFGYSNRFVFLSMLSLISYMAVSYRLIIRTDVDKEASVFKFADIQWLKKLLICLFALLVLWIVAILIKNVFSTNWEYYLLFIPAISFTHWLGFKAYLRQAQLAPAEIEIYNKPAVTTVFFSPQEISDYSARLHQLMDNDTLYLDPLLKLEYLAEKLQLPVKHVSHLLNQHIGKNFNDFVNSYRVDEAKQRLADPTLAHFTIAAIAFDCGFNSLPTFQRCFKQFTGLTPSQYQNSLKLGIAAGKA
ncbi:helix-turn-helix domain-containing protein [Mucilaginibacter sp. dw_454]|uniref:helix-turn-helix domain-containing protein n=1 Tax=Mucilaginibacter sp. dw_454 TaxID=2720079 RepID=UPI001BD6781E